MTSQRQITIKTGLGLLVIASSLGCIVLPSIGARGFFAAFNQPYSAEVHFRLLAGQIVGPTYTLLLSSWFTIMVFLDKRVAWWIWLTVLVGPIYTALAVGGLSHDFSHSVFNECSGIYGTWIAGLCLIGVTLLVSLALLTHYFGRRFQRPETIAEQAASGIRR